MSFGWSVGDILTALEIIYEVSEALRSATGSPDDRKRANQFLSTFQHTISVVQQIYGPNLPRTSGTPIQNEDPSIPPPTELELRSLNELKDLYDKLKDEIDSYAGMNKLPDEKQRNFIHRQIQKVSWHFFAKKQIHDLRDKIADQVQLLQPSLTTRQFQTASIQSQAQHTENLTNFSDIKTAIRVLDSKIASLTPSSLMTPSDGDGSTTISRASTLLPSDPEDYTGYYVALQHISPFVPRLIADTIAASLRRLKCTHKLHSTMKTWLTSLDSASPSSNVLWLLDHPTSTQVSAILFSVLTTLDRPVLAFSCSQLDHEGNDLSPDTLLMNALYSFLYTLLTYINAHPSSVTQRIDAPGFRSLNGTPASIPTAITLLGNLLDNLPCPAVCIIDNFQRLDKSTSSPNGKFVKEQLPELFALFARRPDRAFASYEGTHKLLLTTKGPMGMLADLRQQDKLTRLATKDHILKQGASGGYVLWEEFKTTVEGMKVRETENARR